MSLFPFLIFKVSGNSMLPTLRPNQKVLTFNWVTPQVGQVVVAKQNNRLVIKRIKDKSELGYFLVGDNPKESSDSRQYGWIKGSAIIGKEGASPRVKRPWVINGMVNDDLLIEALDNLESARARNNITIADLPGGQPDEITSKLSASSDYSIRVDGRHGNEAKPWRDYLRYPNMPTNIAEVHTWPINSERRSGIRNRKALTQGDRVDFIRGRVVGLDLKPIPDDPFINFLAHALIFDILPHTILRRLRYGHRLLRSLQYIHD